MIRIRRARRDRDEVDVIATRLLSNDDSCGLLTSAKARRKQSAATMMGSTPVPVAGTVEAEGRCDGRRMMMVDKNALALAARSFGE